MNKHYSEFTVNIQQYVFIQVHKYVAYLRFRLGQSQYPAGHLNSFTPFYSN